MASSILQNIKQTTKQTLDGYRAWEIDAIMAPRADDCMYYALPQSTGMPPRSSTEYREYYTSQIIPLFQNFAVEVKTTMYDPEARKSMVHGFSTADSPIGPYNMEMVMMLSFNEAGDRVVKIEEMFDSAYYQSLIARLQTFLAAQAPQSGK